LRRPKEGRNIGREERRDEMGGVGAKSRVDFMGSISPLGVVTSINSTTEGSSNECSLMNVSPDSMNIPH